MKKVDIIIKAPVITNEEDLREFRKSEAQVAMEGDLYELNVGLLADLIFHYMKKNSLNMTFLDEAVKKVKEMHYETAKF